ncbi:MAG TPA: hypothetical protein PLQ97_08780 [Myxococcota bacterium]|nr:hypothetical protein [Myxococcota bacterium]HQK51361.1 hypothetical protein [Myxococcota bacterium]
MTFSDLPEDLRDLARQLDPEGCPTPTCLVAAHPAETRRRRKERDDV